MIDIELIKKDLEAVEKRLNKRGEKFDLSMILQNYSAKNQLQVSLDDLKNKKTIFPKKLAIFPERVRTLQNLKKNLKTSAKKSMVYKLNITKLMRYFSMLFSKYPICLT